MDSKNEVENMETNDGHDCENGMCWKWKPWFLAIPFVIVGVILIKSALVLWLWNALIPDLFHGPTISLIQAVQMTVLAKLLVGFGGHHGHFKHHRHGRHKFWKHRWSHMSPDEKEKLRKEIQNCCEK